MLLKDRVALWREQNPVINEWLNNFKLGTQRYYAQYAYFFFRWIDTEAPEPYRGKTPAELLDMQDSCVRQREQFKQVDLVKRWVKSRKGRHGTKTTLKTIIYSFYASSHVPLPKDVTWNVNGDLEKIEGYLTVDELRQIIISSNKMYQAVFTCMWQGAMGLEELLYFNTHSWPQVKKQLDEGSRRIRIDLPGRKHRNKKPGGPYFTFLGKDSIKKLRQYLAMRGQHYRDIPRPLPLVEEAIFVTENWRPITKHAVATYFKRHAWMLGIIERVEKDKFVRYRVHDHEIRDTFRTEWNLTPAKSFMSEFFMGHKIDSNNYNKVMKRPEWAEQQYALAEPWLNILSEDPRKVKRVDIDEIVEERVKKRLAEMKISELTEEDLRKLRRILRLLDEGKIELTFKKSA